MRPNARLGLGVGALLLAATLVLWLAGRDAPTPDDPRLSTWVAGPRGASAYADALERLGLRVERFRRRSESLPHSAVRDPELVLAILGPSRPLDAIDAEAVARFVGTGDLLLAGRGARAAMGCFGWRIRGRGDSTRLVPLGRRSVIDSSNTADGRVARCEVPEPVRVDTLRQALAGASVVRLQLPEGGTVTLAADERLFWNRTLRESSDGPFVLRLVADRYRRVLFDEYHHGYTASGSLAAAVTRWSFTHSWGWAAWQAGAVGLFALLAGGVRFGPARVTTDRRRRSPLDHVRALAAALGAARGHDAAMTLMLRGLHRRLAPAQRPPADLRVWLTEIAPALTTRRGQAAAGELLRLTAGAIDEQGVLRAAGLVEDLWEELRR